MGVAATLLLAANIVYATSYVVTRLVLDDVPPMTLALLRLVLGAAVLVPLARRGATAPIPRGLTPGQGARVFWMGALGFAAAFALSHWGIARSSATNASLLIVVEPLTLVVLGPLLLGERLTRREAAGAALAVGGGGDALPGARDQRRRLSRLELGAGAGRGVAGGAVPHRAAGGRGAARRRRPGRGGHALHRARRRPRRPRPLDDGHRPALSVY